MGILNGRFLTFRPAVTNWFKSSPVSIISVGKALSSSLKLFNNGATAIQTLPKRG